MASPDVIHLPGHNPPLLLEAPAPALPEPTRLRHEFVSGQYAPSDLPVDADGKPKYVPVVDAQEAARQTGFEAPVALHFRVGSNGFALFDLRGYPRDQNGFRQVPVHMPDGRLRSTPWNAEFLITSAEFVNSLKSGDEPIRGVLGLRTARTPQDNVLFGADNPKCQSNFALPDDFPGSCFRMSYNEVPDGDTQHQTLWFVALGPITVTRAEQGQNVLRDTGDNQAIQDQPGTESEPTTEEVTDEIEATDGVAAADTMDDDSATKLTDSASSDVQPIQGFVNSVTDQTNGMVGAQEEHSPSDENTASAQPEWHRPSAADVFASTDAFQNMLEDEQLDPDIREQLLSLQQYWRGVQLAAGANEYWDKTIKGQLIAVTDIMADLRNRGGKLEDLIEETQLGLRRLQSAFEDGGIEDAVAVMQEYSFNSRFEEMSLQANALSQLGTEEAVSNLQESTTVVGEYFQAMVRPSNSLDERQTEAMIMACRALLESGMELREVVKHFGEEYGTISAKWRNRAEAAEVLANFVRRAHEGALEVGIRNAIYEWEEAKGALRLGRFFDADYVSTLLNNPLVETQSLRQITRLTDLATEDYR